MARCDPFTTTIWVALGMERMGGTMQPFMFLPGLGCSGPRAASGSNPSRGSGVLFSTVVLPWGQPKTAWLAHVSR